MRHAIHAQDYRPVVFRDRSTEYQFVTRSTIKTSKTIEVDGTEYPLYDLEISSASHPFYTGQQRFVDSAGRIEKFRRKFGTDYTQPTKKEKKKKEEGWDEE